MEYTQTGIIYTRADWAKIAARNEAIASGLMYSVVETSVNLYNAPIRYMVMPTSDTRGYAAIRMIATYNQNGDTI